MPRRKRSKVATPPPPESGWAYFLDVDGTLLDLAPSPSLVHPDDELHGLIDELRAFCGGALAVISGRSIEDADRFFPGRRLPIAGQHGLERRDAQGRIHVHEISAAAFEDEHAAIASAIDKYPGLIAEFKGQSLALHYRQAPERAAYVHRLARTAASRLGAGYTVQTGKQVVELKPSAKTKGDAVSEFMRERPFAGRTPAFIGDDATDEYAFAVVNEMGGHSVKVGRGRTVARYRLTDVRAVRAWLQSAARARGAGE